MVTNIEEIKKTNTEDLIIDARILHYALYDRNGYFRYSKDYDEKSNLEEILKELKNRGHEIGWTGWTG